MPKLISLRPSSTLSHQLVVLVTTFFVTSSEVAAQSATSAGPPMPYEEGGACPFEGCVYREWIANAPVALIRDRRIGSATSTKLKKGDHVQAITGIVVIVKPGRAQFRKAVDLWTTSGTIRIEPGETLYLLTYHGEGATKAWFKGRLYDEVDGSEFFNGICEEKPGTCDGTILERPKTEWWVRVSTMKGIIGWTNEPEKFDNKDAYGR